MTVKMDVQILSETATLPTYGSAEAAGADLYADIEDVVSIPPHCTEMIPTGIAISVPKGYFGAVYARSGLASKQGLRPANAVGVVDSDYTGEVKVALHNDTDAIRYIKPGDRVAQLVIQPYIAIDFNVVEKLDETERGSGGFGSTGNN